MFLNADIADFLVNQKISYVSIQNHPSIRAGSVSPEQSQPASKSNMTKYPRFHDFHSNPEFSLIIPIINSQHLYGKPPTLLRDLGSKNHQFWSESMFLKKETDYLIWSHRSWYIKHFSLKSAIFGEKNSKNFETSPSSKFAKNGRPEPLRDLGSKNRLFCSDSAFLKGKKDDYIRSY